MTRTAARTTADLILAAAAMAAAYVVITTPPLRRLAGRAARIWLGASIPAYLVAETRRAWRESGRTPHEMARAR
jgi:hypothetical protein